MSHSDTKSAPVPELHRVRRAVVVVDLVESVRAMHAREDEVITQWIRFVQAVRVRVLPEFGGRLVKSLGDGLLLEFESTRAALACIVKLRRALAQSSGSEADADADRNAQALRIRASLHVAQVVVDELDIYGSAVNLAARLATLAPPDGIVASADAVDEIVPGLDADIHDLGDCYFKHIDEPVRAYRLQAPALRVGMAPNGLASAAPRQTALDRPKIAVLTLEGDLGSLVLRNLVADELAAQMAANSSVHIISRLSTRHEVDREAGELMVRLGANYAIGGSFTLLGNGILIVLELTFFPDKRAVWGRSLRATVDRIVEDPGGELRPACIDIMSAVDANETGRARSLPLASLGSYSLLTGGVRLMHRLSRRDFNRSQDIFEALIARHPRHPDGYAWLSKWHILQLHQGWSGAPGHCMGRANDLSRRALDHDDQCAVAMVVAGMVKMFNDRRLGEAEAIFRRTLDIHPNHPLAWLLKSMVHAFRGEGDQAVAHARHASALSPLDPMRYYFDSLGASAEAAAGHYERAIELAERSLAANAMHASTLRILAIACAMLERMEAASDAVRRLLLMEPQFTVQRFCDRSPSSDYAIGRVFADALHRAGVPA